MLYYTLLLATNKRTDFTSNPRTVNSITSDPTKNHLNNEANLGEIDFSDPVLAAYKNVSATPTQKYKFPVTSSMELGWHKPAASAQPEKGDQWIRTKTSCEETRYAAKYNEAVGCSPFRNVDSQKT